MSSAIAPSEPESVTFAKSRTGEQAGETRQKQIIRHQKRWARDEPYRNYSCLVGRTFASPDIYSVWPWRPDGEYTRHPDEILGRRGEMWRAMTKNSPTPTQRMVDQVTALIRQYGQDGTARYDYRLPTHPDDRSYLSANSVPTPVLLQFRREELHPIDLVL